MSGVRVVQKHNNMALAELQTELHEVFGIEMSMQTIARTLQQEGYTMKTVHPFFLLC